ncbi:metallophosphoesterase [Brevibacterium daeguense]|uniref:Metallophosphoesterase n=1 Tax=Brevibacterium daeguense TaxID=909936 RepID=A0ABP8EKY4_9MICO|nr:metallophosphoesterase [Brevibacterium daeguense]
MANPLLAGLGALAAVGAAGGVWAAGIEPHLFRVRRHRLTVLPAGAPVLRVLHVSDLHLASWQHHKKRWVHGLRSLEPDLVVNTGDNMSADLLDDLLDTYGDLLDLPGVFVLGSNDFHAAEMKNPARYLFAPSEAGGERSKPGLPTREMVDAFTARSWLQLDNRDAELTVKGVRISFSGLGDAHMDADRITAGHPAFASGAGVRIGVTHAPYLRTLDAFAEAGADVVFAGHTHGGQLRIPFWGAPVTNCDLDRSRARGVFDHRGTAVEISAGLGFSPYAPVRFACPPEVSLVELAPRTA